MKTCVIGINCATDPKKRGIAIAQYVNGKCEHPNINSETVCCQIMQDCVNHNSRKHYPRGLKDPHFRNDKGVFRLYGPAKDGKRDSKGKK